MNTRQTTPVRIAACFALAALLAWTGGIKAVNPAAFAENIMNFRLTPWPVAAALAHYVPWLELVVAGGLLVPRLRAGALCAATTLFALFAILWAVTWARGLDVSCGCFGGSGKTPAAWALARTVALAAGAAWLSRRTARDSGKRGC